jgi:hypothetical protein
MKGEVTLDDKYMNDEMTSSANGQAGKWTKITEGATLLIQSKQKEGTSTGGSKEKNKETW